MLHLKILNRRALLGLFILTGSGSAASMEPMADTEMASVAGRDGVALDIEIRANANSDGTPREDVLLGGDPAAWPDSASAGSASPCTGANNYCRLALEFEGREGKWLVFKDYHAVLRYNDLFLDAGRLSTTSSTCSAGSNGCRDGANTYRDLPRFEDESGQPLLSDPNGLPALAISFPDSRVVSKADIEVTGKVGRLSAEFDDDNGTPGDPSDDIPGYLLDNISGSAIAIAVGNTSVSTNFAEIDVDGTMKVFGF